MKLTQTSSLTNKVYVLNYDVWFGRMSITVNNQSSTKIKRLVFNYTDEDLSPKTITVRGNVLTGFKLNDSGEEILMQRPLVWYEWVLVILPIAIGILGGALGGGLGALAGISSAFVIRQTNSVIMKVVVSIVFAGIAFLVYSVLAAAILGLL
jgi:hypothetical protein